ncbi:MAG: hypothetical protein RIB98_14520 [Acidimicrobiales bacterium]
MSDHGVPDRDERVAIPLDPEEALKALLAVDPDRDPVEDGTESEDLVD